MVCNFQQFNPQQRRGKLNARQIWKVAADELDCDNVFYNMRPGEKLDTAVTVLIDESGSMKNIMHNVVNVAMIVAEALHGTKIPFYMMGHTTTEEIRYEGSKNFDRHNPLLLPIYKEWNESWVNVCPRLMAASGKANNCDVEAVNYAYETLKNRKEKRKIMIVLSDGQPNCGNRDGSKMTNALKPTLEKMRKSGVEIYNIALDSDRPIQFYGREWSIRLNVEDDGFGHDFAKRITDIIMAGRFNLGKAA